MYLTYHSHISDFLIPQDVFLIYPHITGDHKKDDLHLEIVGSLFHNGWSALERQGTGLMGRFPVPRNVFTWIKDLIGRNYMFCKYTWNSSKGISIRYSVAVKVGQIVLREEDLARN